MAERRNRAGGGAAGGGAAAGGGGAVGAGGGGGSGAQLFSLFGTVDVDISAAISNLRQLEGAAQQAASAQQRYVAVIQQAWQRAGSGTNQQAQNILAVAKAALEAGQDFQGMLNAVGALTDPGTVAQFKNLQQAIDAAAQSGAKAGGGNQQQTLSSIIGGIRAQGRAATQTITLPGGTTIDRGMFSQAQLQQIARATAEAADQAERAERQFNDMVEAERKAIQAARELREIEARSTPEGLQRRVASIQRELQERQPVLRIPTMPGGEEYRYRGATNPAAMLESMGPLIRATAQLAYGNADAQRSFDALLATERQIIGVEDQLAQRRANMANVGRIAQSWIRRLGGDEQPPQEPREGPPQPPPNGPPQQPVRVQVSRDPSAGGLRKGNLSASETAQLARYQQILDVGGQLGPRQNTSFQRLLARATAPPEFERGLAEGGPAYAGHRYLVGERGPEVFVPDQDGYVAPQFERELPGITRMSGRPRYQGKILTPEMFGPQGPGTVYQSYRLRNRGFEPFERRDFDWNKDTAESWRAYLEELEKNPYYTVGLNPRTGLGYVGMIRVPDELQGQGIAGVLYRHMAEQAHAQGTRIFSGYDRQPEARRALERAAASGLVGVDRYRVPTDLAGYSLKPYYLDELKKSEFERDQFARDVRHVLPALQMIQRPIFTGQPIPQLKRLTNQATGDLGEDIVVQYMRQFEGLPAEHASLRRKNTPFDIRALTDMRALLVEAKAGSIANSRDAQKWRLKFGGSDTAESLGLTPEEFTLWASGKTTDAFARKASAVAATGLATGLPVATRTMAAIIDADRQLADLFSFPGLHDVIRWRSDETKQGYLGSVHFEYPKDINWMHPRGTRHQFQRERRPRNLRQGQYLLPGYEDYFGRKDTVEERLIQHALRLWEERQNALVAWNSGQSPKLNDWLFDDKEDDLAAKYHKTSEAYDKALQRLGFRHRAVPLVAEPSAKELRAKRLERDARVEQVIRRGLEYREQEAEISKINREYAELELWEQIHEHYPGPSVNPEELAATARPARVTRRDVLPTLRKYRSVLREDPEARGALEEYVSSPSVNSELRAVYGDASRISGHYASYVSGLDKLFNEATPLQSTRRVYRGTNPPWMRGVADPTTLIGKTVYDYGYQSSAITRRGARGFGYGQNYAVSLIIDVPAGEKLLPIHDTGKGLGGEQEVLLNRNRGLKIYNVRKTAGGQTFVMARLTELPEEALEPQRAGLHGRREPDEDAWELPFDEPGAGKKGIDYGPGSLYDYIPGKNANKIADFDYDGPVEVYEDYTPSGEYQHLFVDPQHTTKQVLTKTFPQEGKHYSTDELKSNYMNWVDTVPTDHPGLVSHAAGGTLKSKTSAAPEAGTLVNYNHPTYGLINGVVAGPISGTHSILKFNKPNGLGVGTINVPNHLFNAGHTLDAANVGYQHEGLEQLITPQPPTTGWKPGQHVHASLQSEGGTLWNGVVIGGSQDIVDFEYKTKSGKTKTTTVDAAHLIEGHSTLAENWESLAAGHLYKGGEKVHYKAGDGSNINGTITGQYYDFYTVQHADNPHMVVTVAEDDIFPGHLATKEQLAQLPGGFTKGQTVTFNEQGYSMLAGQIGTVVGAAQGSEHTYLKVRHSQTGKVWMMNPHEIDPMGKSWKVGEQVKINSPDSGYHGKYGVIKQITPLSKGKPIMVHHVQLGDAWVPFGVEELDAPEFQREAEPIDLSLTGGFDIPGLHVGAEIIHTGAESTSIVKRIDPNGVLLDTAWAGARKWPWDRLHADVTAGKAIIQPAMTEPLPSIKSRLTPRTLESYTDEELRQLLQESDYYRRLSTQQRFALGHYGASGYVDINQALRFPNDPNNKRALARLQEFKEYLDQAISLGPELQQPLDVHRRVRTNIFGPGATKANLTGRTFTDPGYVSTSTRDPGKTFGEHLQHIRLPAGTRFGSPYISPEGRLGIERELILPRGSSFRIHSAEYIKDAPAGSMLTRMELLPRQFQHDIPSAEELMALPVTGGQGGSQEGGWRGDYYIKPQTSEERAENEFGAMLAYRLAGAVPGRDIPSTAIRDINGVPNIVSRKLTGLSSIGRGSPELSEAAKKYWGLDTLLAHYDVVGMALDNMYRTAQGGAARIETGGTMAFRAMGGPKRGWTVSESPEQLYQDVLSMRGTHPQYPNEQLESVFGGISNDEAARLLEEVHKTLDVEQLAKTWQEAGIHTPKSRETLEVIKARLSAIPGVAKRLRGQFQPDVASLRLTPQQVGGFHEKSIYEDSQGARWMFKPDVAAAHGEIAGYNVQRLLGLPTPEAHIVTIGGETGSLQKFHEGVTGEVEPSNLVSLTNKQRAQIQEQHVLDWLISQYDTHKGNLLIGQTGDILGIDKGQAFKFFGKSGESPSPNYQPNNSPQIYKQLFENARAGKYELPREAINPILKRIEGLPNEALTKAVSPYAEYASKRGWIPDVQSFYDKVIARKQGIRATFDKVYADAKQFQSEEHPTADLDRFIERAERRLEQLGVGSDAESNWIRNQLSAALALRQRLTRASPRARERYAQLYGPRGVASRFNRTLYHTEQEPAVNFYDRLTKQFQHGGLVGVGGPGVFIPPVPGQIVANSRIHSVLSSIDPRLRPFASKLKPWNASEYAGRTAVAGGPVRAETIPATGEIRYRPDIVFGDQHRLAGTLAHEAAHGFWNQMPMVQKAAYVKAHGQNAMEHFAEEATKTLRLPTRGLGGSVVGGQPYWVGEYGAEMYVPSGQHQFQPVNPNQVPVIGLGQLQQQGLGIIGRGPLIGTGVGQIQQVPMAPANQAEVQQLQQIERLRGQINAELAASEEHYQRIAELGRQEQTAQIEAVQGRINAALNARIQAYEQVTAAARQEFQVEQQIITAQANTTRNFTQAADALQRQLVLRRQLANVVSVGEGPFRREFELPEAGPERERVLRTAAQYRQESEQAERQRARNQRAVDTAGTSFIDRLTGGGDENSFMNLFSGFGTGRNANIIRFVAGIFGIPLGINIFAGLARDLHNVLAQAFEDQVKWETAVRSTAAVYGSTLAPAIERAATVMSQNPQLRGTAQEFLTAQTQAQAVLGRQAIGATPQQTAQVTELAGGLARLHPGELQNVQQATPALLQALQQGGEGLQSIGIDLSDATVAMKLFGQASAAYVQNLPEAAQFQARLTVATMEYQEQLARLGNTQTDVLSKSEQMQRTTDRLGRNLAQASSLFGQLGLDIGLFINNVLESVVRAPTTGGGAVRTPIPGAVGGPPAAQALQPPQQQPAQPPPFTLGLLGPNFPAPFGTGQPQAQQQAPPPQQRAVLNPQTGQPYTAQQVQQAGAGLNFTPALNQYQQSVNAIDQAWRGVNEALVQGDQNLRLGIQYGQQLVQQFQTIDQLIGQRPGGALGFTSQDVTQLGAVRGAIDALNEAMSQEASSGADATRAARAFLDAEIAAGNAPNASPEAVRRGQAAQRVERTPGALQQYMQVERDLATLEKTRAQANYDAAQAQLAQSTLQYQIQQQQLSVADETAQHRLNSLRVEDAMAPLLLEQQRIQDAITIASRSNLDIEKQLVAARIAALAPLERESELRYQQNIATAQARAIQARYVLGIAAPGEARQLPALALQARRAALEQAVNEPNVVQANRAVEVAQQAQTRDELTRQQAILTLYEGRRREIETQLLMMGEVKSSEDSQAEALQRSTAEYQAILQPAITITDAAGQRAQHEQAVVSALESEYNWMKAMISLNTEAGAPGTPITEAGGTVHGIVPGGATGAVNPALAPTLTTQQAQVNGQVVNVYGPTGGGGAPSPTPPPAPTPAQPAPVPTTPIAAPVAAPLTAPGLGTNQTNQPTVPQIPTPQLTLPPAGARDQVRHAIGRQYGGPVGMGQLYLVGERGPELFVPQMAGAILPTPKAYAPLAAIQASPMSAGFNMGDMTINAGAHPDQIAQFAQEVADQFRGQLIQALRGARPGLHPGMAGVRR